MVNIIVAVNRKGFIGKDNKLLWNNPEDLQMFKKLTEGHTIVMGRKTWDSLPKKPLPNRYSLIISRTQDFQGENFHTIDSVDPQYMKDSKELFWIIGGAEIYKQFLPFADNVYVSLIKNDSEGDAKFDLDWVKSNMTCKIIRYNKTFKQRIYAQK